MQTCMQGYPELFEEKERKQDDKEEAPKENIEESAATEEPVEKSTPSEPQWNITKLKQGFLAVAFVNWFFLLKQKQNSSLKFYCFED